MLKYNKSITVEYCCVVMSIEIIAFYKFVSFPDCTTKRETIFTHCQANQIKGTILLAPEGINGTIAGERENIKAVLDFLRSDPRLADLEYKTSWSEFPPFKRLKVKVKKEIVTLGLPEVDPSQVVGTYVDPQHWNQIISDPEVIVLDTRNEYEVKIGTFKGAIDPKTHCFREFPDYVAQNFDPKKFSKVAMFCTGGIRCEKASSFMLKQGFKEVYHLKGGILKYLEEINPQDSLWEGECFVFDERVAVVEGVKKGHYELCLACGHPINEKDKTSPHYQADVSCPHCYYTLSIV